MEKYEFTDSRRLFLYGDQEFNAALIDELDAINKNLVKLTESLNNSKER